MATRYDWGTILAEATAIVGSYDTPVTLRQLFYRLVAAELLPNVQGAYKGLSSKTAEARREGTFPDLSDRTRSIHQYQHWASPQDALNDAASCYRVDRTEGQKVSLYLGVEKATMVNQMQSWFGDLGVPILALSGYASQSYTDTTARHADAQDRPAVLLYAGDHDPSGEDIDRDFVARTGCFDIVERVALSSDQVAQYALPVAPGKTTDSRKASFIARHGELVQVELEALAPDVLQGLFTDAIAQGL